MAVAISIENLKTEVRTHLSFPVEALDTWLSFRSALFEARGDARQAAELLEDDWIELRRTGQTIVPNGFIIEDIRRLNELTSKPPPKTRFERLSDSLDKNSW